MNQDSSIINHALTPVPQGERVFSWRDHACLWFSLGVGLLVMQVGAYLVPATGIREAALACFFGSLLGAGLLGWIAGGMMITDVFVIEHLGEPSRLTQWTAHVAGAALVVMAGKFLELSMNERLKPDQQDKHKQTGSANMTLLKWLALLGIVGIAAYLLLRQFTA